MTQLPLVILIALNNLRFVVSKIEVEWFVQSYDKISTTLGEEIELTWEGTHDVFEFPERQSFNDCNFSAATQICGLQLQECELVARAESAFYGCSINGHCANGQKIEIAGDLQIARLSLEPLEVLSISFGGVLFLAAIFKAILQVRMFRKAQESPFIVEEHVKSRPEGWEGSMAGTSPPVPFMVPKSGREQSTNAESSDYEIPKWRNISARLQPGFRSISSSISGRSLMRSRGINSEKALQDKLRHFYTRNLVEKSEKEIKQIANFVKHIGIDSFDQMLEEKYGDSILQGQKRSGKGQRAKENPQRYATTDNNGMIESETPEETENSENKKPSIDTIRRVLGTPKGGEGMLELANPRYAGQNSERPQTNEIRKILKGEK